MTTSAVKQTPQQQPVRAVSTFSASDHSHYGTINFSAAAMAAKVTPAEPSPPSEKASQSGVRFSSVSKRGRYTSPAGRRSGGGAVDVGSPAPSLCSAPSHDEPKKPAAFAVKEDEVGSVESHVPTFKNWPICSSLFCILFAIFLDLTHASFLLASL